MLPRLATGIDVNIKFKRLVLLISLPLVRGNDPSRYSDKELLNYYCRINDFEFTSECAIFDLLDISLYHGWIVDPQVGFLCFACIYSK